MSRLRHSESACLRRLQISRHNLFAFVEGPTLDPFFYGRICLQACKNNGISYRVCTANELPENAGGKTSLVRFYRYVRAKGKLVSELNGKRTALVFFLDKDLDDIGRCKCRSHHVIYTKYYDAQNHVFKHADFIRGVSSAASIDISELA